jgi:putative inorganic carbon (HCO3(-)) transporter
MFNLILFIIMSPYTALFIGVYTTYKVIRMKEEIQKNTWNVGLILLFLWSLLVGILNKSIMSTIVSIVFFLYFTISVVLQNYCKTEEKLEIICRYLIKFSVFSAIIGLIEKVAFAYFPMELWKKILGVPLNVSTNHRIYSTFGNPNIAGDWFAIMIIVALYYASNSQGFKKKVAYYCCITLFLINLCLAGSRGAFIGLMFGLGALLLLKVKRSKNDAVIILSIALVIGIVGFTPQKVSDISEEVTGHHIERSFDTREEIWLGSLRMIEKKPLTGWGMVGTIEHGNEFSRYSAVINHSHNIWLSLLTSLGVVGLIIYLYIRAHIYKDLIYLYKSGYSSVALLMAIQVIVLVHGVIDFTIITPQIGILFIGSSSIITTLAKESVSVFSKRRSIAV